MEEMRLKAGAQNYHGHEYMDLERFAEDTRFISINDDFDSDQHKGDTGGMDVAFKYLISEYYSRDMSIKTKSAKYAKMQRGEYQSKVCPYG